MVSGKVAGAPVTERTAATASGDGSQGGRAASGSGDPTGKKTRRCSGDGVAPVKQWRDEAATVEFRRVTSGWGASWVRSPDPDLDRGGGERGGGVGRRGLGFDRGVGYGEWVGWPGGLMASWVEAQRGRGVSILF